ncbi:MAG: hypothetical protein ACJ8AW_53930 [Rhodopila sp.]
MQTILLGQPQFRPMLASKDVEQLRQRVLASCHLGPLAEDETRRYIEHRLRTVGWTDDPAWDEDAFAAVHRNAGGIPRRINTLCSRVLLLGALEEAHTITAAMVEDTAEELRRDLGDGQAGGSQAGDGQAGNRQATPGQPPLANDLAQRIETLEALAARQDRISQRILTLLEAGAVGAKADAQV